MRATAAAEYAEWQAQVDQLGTRSRALDEALARGADSEDATAAASVDDALLSDLADLVPGVDWALVLGEAAADAAAAGESSADQLDGTAASRSAASVQEQKSAAAVTPSEPD